MLTKTLKIEQVNIGALNEWSNEYKTALGELVLACSQWEYVYELIWKDLNANPKTTFLEIMREADKKVLAVENNLKKPLQDRGFKEMEALIGELEGLRNKRHVMIHGFHHIHEGDCLITRVAAGKGDVIGEEVSIGDISSSASAINTKIRELNALRRKNFHTTKIASAQKKVN